MINNEYTIKDIDDNEHEFKVIGKDGTLTSPPVTKTLRRSKRESMNTEAIQNAINWAVAKANDDSWGYPPRHRAGCYICGTSPTKEYTCMPFITAAYAHGAKDPEVMSICRRGHSLETTDDNFNLNCFRMVSRCKDMSYSDLQPGDVLVQYASNNDSGHMCMFIGDGKLVHATGHSTGIQVTSNASNYFGRLHNGLSNTGEGSKNYVMRYVGQGGGTVYELEQYD